MMYTSQHTQPWRHHTDPATIIKVGDYFGSPTYSGDPTYLKTDLGCCAARVFPVNVDWIGKPLSEARAKTTWSYWCIHRKEVSYVGT